METVDHLPPRQYPHNPDGLKHPMDTILDGHPHLLHLGADYTYAQSTVRTYLRREATHRGGTVEVRLLTPTTIGVHYHPPV